MARFPIFPILLLSIYPFLAQANTCELHQHWDGQMQMCMPDGPTPEETNECEKGEHWDEAMHMCMEKEEFTTDVEVGFHLNQFLVQGTTTGARGRAATYAPSMYMMNLEKAFTPKNHLELEVMATADKWLVPEKGYPELFQTGEANNDGVPYLDAQHPHSSPIMGLTLADVFELKGKQKLTFYFAPRGEATAGPEAFMHRESSAGNPYTPLSHHLQDVFHITSTVIGAKLGDEKNKIEVSTFSGQEPQPEKINLDMHKPDSYGLRYTRELNKNWSAGASYANVFSNPLLPDVGEPAQSHVDYISANLLGDHPLANGILNTGLIWGMAHNETTHIDLHSFLGEFVYQKGKNNFFGRMEVLQRSSDQLGVSVSNPDGEVKWVKQITLGYERKIVAKKTTNLFFGGSFTQYFTPADFQDTYGANPMGLEFHLRLNFMAGKMEMAHSVE